MTHQPLVSVICLCYNQAPWVEEAVASVLNQTYSNIELIIVDDASTDDSPVRIKKLKQAHPSIDIILFEENKGNCRAFNEGYKRSAGEFIIDFAADDVLMPDRVEKQVAFFRTLDPAYGVVFTDAAHIDTGGNFIRNHYQHLFGAGLLQTVPEGDVYKDVLSRYFIASPTMMVKRAVFEKLNGYDESLAYEDFDFWVRSARYYKYGFLNERLTAIRKRYGSMSGGWYKAGDRQLHSTYLVCRKAMTLNRNDAEKESLLKRIRFELRQAIFSGNHAEATLFFTLLKELRTVTSKDRLLHAVNRLHIDLSWLRNLYQRLRFGVR